MLRRRVSRLTRDITFFLLRQEESKQRRRRPRVGAGLAPGSLRYSVLAGAAELGPAGLGQSSPFSRQALRCSAPPRGQVDTDRSFAVDAENGRKMRCTAHWLFVAVAYQVRRCWAPWEAPSNAGGTGAFGSHCLSRRRVHASRPSCRVAQGTPRSGAPTQGSPFSLVTFFLAKQKESTPAVTRGIQRIRKPTAQPEARRGAREPPTLRPHPCTAHTCNAPHKPPPTTPCTTPPDFPACTPCRTACSPAAS